MTFPSLKKSAKLHALRECVSSTEVNGYAELSPGLDVVRQFAVDGKLSFADSSLEGVLAVDVLEHVEKDSLLLGELHRVIKAGGVLCLSVPRSERHLGLNRLRWMIGMIPAVYGHVREGYSCRELSKKLHAAGFAIVSMQPFSGPFTEMIEMALNRFYLALSGSGISPRVGPASASKKAALILYSIAYPLLRLIAMLDRIAFPTQRYAIMAKAIKESSGS